MRRTATSQEIQKWVADRYGFTPESGWIAHCQETYRGLAADRQGGPYFEPCPPDKQIAIKKALEHFGMLA